MSQFNSVFTVQTGKRGDVPMERSAPQASIHDIRWPLFGLSPSPSSVSKAPKVAILLCTYHGQHFLADQLDSFAAQTHVNWQVCASDDGSQDNTHAILAQYQHKWGAKRLSMQAGPAQGFAANFLSLSCDTSIQADYYAYSDQDDIWEADKLQRALNWLSGISPDMPALYCSRALLVDVDNQAIGTSPLFTHAPSFANALVQSIGGGNTMVFNNALRKLLIEAGKDVQIISHDCWAYMVASGCGGKVFYDAHPSLRYRQHDANLVGTNRNWRARYSRMRHVWNGWFRNWNDHNIASLQRLHDRLTPENQRILDDFAKARQSWLIPRLWLMKRSGIHRQSRSGTIAFYLAAIFNKI